MNEELMARVWPRLAMTGACWVWTGTLSRGYGIAMEKRDGRWTKNRVHRLTYQYFVGPVPDGLVLDHLCRNRACALPAHLEAVTHRVNLLRGVGATAQNARKTHCKAGHPLIPENLIKSKPSRRMCNICHLRYERERYARRRLCSKREGE